jgi:hypothetical protein
VTDVPRASARPNKTIFVQGKEIVCEGPTTTGGTEWTAEQVVGCSGASQAKVADPYTATVQLGARWWLSPKVGTASGRIRYCELHRARWSLMAAVPRESGRRGPGDRGTGVGSESMMAKVVSGSTTYRTH